VLENFTGDDDFKKAINDFAKDSHFIACLQSF
jgi:hypothetical protein